MPISLHTSRQPWTRRPSGLLQIDRSSPLARNLLAAWTGTHGGGRLVYPYARHLAASGWASQPSPVFGEAALTSGNTYLDYAVPSPTSVDVTAAMWFTFDQGATTSYVSPWQHSSTSSANDGYRVTHDSYKRIFWTHGGVNMWASVTVTNEQAPLLLVFRKTGTTVDGWLWEEGQNLKTSNATVTAWNGTPANLRIGGDNGGGFRCPFSCLWIWDRALATSEVFALRDPRTRWSLFAPVVRRTYGDLGGGGSQYSFTAESGSYVLSGTDVAVRIARTFAAESGTYTLSGTDAVFKASRLLAGDAGAFTFSGSDAVLKAARMIVGESGTFVLEGLDVTLTYTPLGGYAPLIAESGTFTLSGTDIALKVSRKLQADAGAFSLAGTDVTLGKQYNLVATVGEFTLTGENVSFIKSSRLGAETGSYTLVGHNATLRYSGELSPERFIRLNSPFSSESVVTLTLSPSAPLTTGVTDSLKDE